MAVCDDVIAYDVQVDCAELPVAGLEDDAVLINRSDIDFDACVFDNTQTNIVTDLVLKTGKQGYKVKQMKTSFNGTKWEQAEGTYRNGAKHTFAFVNPDRSAKGKELDSLILNGKFVAVIENKAAPDNGKFEILGFHTGLSVPTVSRDYVATEVGGVTAITLASNENEPKAPYCYYKTSLAVTRAAFEALTEEPV